MSKKTILLVAGILLTAIALASCAGSQGPEGPQGPTGPAGPAGPAGPVAEAASVGAEYVGSAACGECHTDTYEVFMQSGHPYKLSPVVGGQPPEYPFTSIDQLPEGYTWDDVSYVIGGYNWKARFMNKEGYIITDEPGKSGNADYLNQWNFANPIVGRDAGWVKYSSGVENKPYDCGTCHTTGYNPDVPTEGMPGIVGSWAEPGIQCEECHGPGSLHVANPRGVALKVERDSELCGECHIRGPVEAVDAKGGFIEHHEQYEELFQSKHITINCVTCHEPHSGVVQLRQAGEQATRTTCESCHFQQVSNRKSMQSVACVDCHMPRVTKSAQGDAEKFTGDIRTHLMAIDPNQIGQFSEDGSTALSELGLDFACKSCHGTSFDDATLQAEANGYHDEE